MLVAGGGGGVEGVGVKRVRRRREGLERIERS